MWTFGYPENSYLPISRRPHTYYTINYTHGTCSSCTRVVIAVLGKSTHTHAHTHIHTHRFDVISGWATRYRRYAPCSCVGSYSYRICACLPANRTSAAAAAAAVAIGACRTIVGKRRADHEWTRSLRVSNGGEKNKYITRHTQN